ncbi:MAG: Hsp20/alpha crystallin family protein [Planctomycetaceae bacterium]|nr:Hsp20/alpha crystallin family protein [Planctomycetaceae bacterium]
MEAKIDETFDQLIHAPWGRAVENWRPAVDVYETVDAYLIVADLPGVPPDQVEVRVERQRLTIRGVRHTVTRAEYGRSLQIERSHGEFSRSIDLEHSVDEARLETWSEHGTFRARVPKRPSVHSSERQG